MAKFEYYNDPNDPDGPTDIGHPHDSIGHDVLEDSDALDDPDDPDDPTDSTDRSTPT